MKFSGELLGSILKGRETLSTQDQELDNKPWKSPFHEKETWVAWEFSVVELEPPKIPSLWLRENRFLGKSWGPHLRVDFFYTGA